MNPMPHSSVAGIYIGYPSSYSVYSSILLPIIESYHFDDNVRQGKTLDSAIKNQQQHNRQRLSLLSQFTKRHSRANHSINTTNNTGRPIRGGTGRAAALQRHETNLNPKELVQRKLDDDGRYILYTRMRLARIELHDVR
jgi:hypothetical protein